jgi:hypothetical protein
VYVGHLTELAAFEWTSSLFSCRPRDQNEQVAEHTAVSLFDRQNCGLAMSVLWWHRLIKVKQMRNWFGPTGQWGSGWIGSSPFCFQRDHALTRNKRLNSTFLLLDYTGLRSLTSFRRTQHYRVRPESNCIYRRVLLSVMWRHVVRQEFTNVTEKPAASFFRVEEWASRNDSEDGGSAFSRKNMLYGVTFQSSPRKNL